MQGKKSFLLYTDMIHIFDELTDQQAGQLIKHIFQYVNDKDPKIKSQLLKIAFAPIKNALKKDLDEWLKICERNLENGKKGGRPKNPIKPKKPSGFFGNPKNPVKPDMDIDIDKDIINKQEEIFQNIKNDKIWIEGVKEMNSCDSNEVYGHITTFKLHCRTNGHLKESEADAKKHFLNWIKKGNPIPSCRHKEYILPKRTENRNPI